ncbi:tetratricopeptide repeat [Holotrichia oblita]|uniref:Tetratricopeptide repeat n=1 Tax=Holotrichia oblita TaxID=644536 RepID=A0ACB9T6J9_HOLOL|nr:tetratricopeptide repeat [Holotrichia oblita]
MTALLLKRVGVLVKTCLEGLENLSPMQVTGVVGRAETLSSVFFLAAFMLYCKAAKSRKVTGAASVGAQITRSSSLPSTSNSSVTQDSVPIKKRKASLLYERDDTKYLRELQRLVLLKQLKVLNFKEKKLQKELNVEQNMRLPEIKDLIKSAITVKSTHQLPWSSEATKRLSVLAVTTICLLLARLQIMGSQLPVFTRFDNPASVAPTPSRQLTYHYLISVNLWLLLFPCDLCCDWTMGTIPLVESVFDPRNLSTITAYTFLVMLVAAAVLTENRQQSVLILMLYWDVDDRVVCTLYVYILEPGVSNLTLPSGVQLILPSRLRDSRTRPLHAVDGFLPVSGVRLDDPVREKGKKLAWLAVGLLVAAHGTKTYLRNWDWESEYSIFMSGLRVNQRNAKLFNNVGHALESQGKYTEALRYFQTAVSVQEDDVGAHINVGRTYNHLKMFKEAEEAYLKAKSLLPKAKPGESYQARIAPNHLNVFLNLANLISKNSTRLEEADMLYRQAISMRADYTQAYINRGDILIKLNRTKEAQEVYERALLYDSNNPDIYYNLGVVFLEQGKASQALAYLDKALEFDPEHEQALLNSAILLQELGRAELRKIARERLLKLLAKDANNERVHFNLGMLAMDDKNIEEAEHWFRRAVHLKADFRSALFNLALLLADDHRPLEAAPFLNQLVKYHPDHIKGLILLGDIYINNIKDLDAAENCYKRILELDPENIQGLHNLCVVHVERGKLLEAQSCLEKAHELAPNEDYVLRHLQIVQNRIAKLKPNSKSDETDDYGSKSKVVSNKSIDETERKTRPVVTGDSEEQRYSSRVVNTEPMFVKHVDNTDVDFIDDTYDEGNLGRVGVSMILEIVGNRGNEPIMTIHLLVCLSINYRLIM